MALLLDHLGASSLADLLKTEFTGRTAAQDRLDEITHAAVVASGKEVWYYRPWPHRKPRVNLYAYNVTGVGTGVYTAGTTVLSSPAAVFASSMVGLSVVIAGVGTFTITVYTSATAVTVSGDATCTNNAFTISVTGTCTGVYADPITTVTATASVFAYSMIGLNIVIAGTGTFLITGYTSPTIVTVTGDATCAGAAFTTAVTGTGLGIHSAGTTAFTATTAILSAGMVGVEIVITGIGTFLITGYTGTTIISLAGDATCAGVAFTINPEYSALPSNFGGAFFVPKRGLYDTGDMEERVEYANPLLWADMVGDHEDETGRPEHFTVAYRTLNGVSTPVVEWLPKPDDSYTIGGLVVGVEFPDITFGAVGSTTDQVLFPKQLDGFWETAARLHLLGSGRLGVTGEPRFVELEARLARNAYERARLQAGEYFELVRDALSEREMDVTDTAQELQSADGVLLEGYLPLILES